MSSSIERWVEHEFAGAHFGDARLDRRFRSLLVDLGRHCGKTLASSFEAWSGIKAAYRFFANAKVDERTMLAPHIAQTVVRARDHETILSLQDTVYLDYNKRVKTAHLDFVQRTGHGKTIRGLMLHNTLAVSTDGSPIGLLDQRFIDRKSFHGNNAREKNEIRHCNEAIGDKESRRWFDVVQELAELDFGRTRVVHVADREGDIYEFFRDCAGIGQHVLVRAARDRSINKKRRREMPTEKLFDALRGRRALGKIDVQVQVNGTKKFRRATLSVIHMTFTMPPPPNKTVTKDGPNLPMVPLQAIMAIERKAPANAEPIEWTLLTDLSVDGFDEAVEKVQWYARRWNIEVFHKVLKSGCGVEDAQLRTAERLKKHTVLRSIIAWRLFWLGRLRELDEHTSCEVVLSKEEYSLLYRKANRSAKAPLQAPTVGEALVWIAKLGGYIGRPSDPPPGVTSLWRGWQRLMEMIDDQRDLCGSS